MIAKLKAILAILRADRYAVFAITDLTSYAKTVGIHASLSPKKDAQYLRFIDSLESTEIVDSMHGAPTVDPRLN